MILPRSSMRRVMGWQSTWREWTPSCFVAPLVRPLSVANPSVNAVDLRELLRAVSDRRGLRPQRDGTIGSGKGSVGIPGTVVVVCRELRPVKCPGDFTLPWARGDSISIGVNTDMAKAAVPAGSRQGQRGGRGTSARNSSTNMDDCCSFGAGRLALSVAVAGGSAALCSIREWCAKAVLSNRSGFGLRRQPRKKSATAEVYPLSAHSSEKSIGFPVSVPVNFSKLW
mmetsp:Transcript_9887/g.22708  ORF Transcript_9887/g.22708 Transcript_9887/m.22708 type:complete len:226 (-) Transcript_9887:914-1591(-)